jgi:hypothetical protein
MTPEEFNSRLQAAIDAMATVDTRTRARTQTRFTAPEIVAAKRAIYMVQQLLNAGGYGVAFEETSPAPLTIRNNKFD